MRLRRSPDVRLQIVLALEVEAPWWPTSCTAGDTQAYAHCMRDLVDIHYPDARSSGSSKIIYRPIPPAPCIRRSPQLMPGGFCDGSSSTTTPKHTSWLNMVEIEIGVLPGQCLDRRIDDPKRLRREITAWERQRNAAHARIKWMFTTDKVRLRTEADCRRC